MPTPSDSSASLQFPSDTDTDRLNHTSCPPEQERSLREPVALDLASTALDQNNSDAPQRPSVSDESHGVSREDTDLEVTAARTTVEAHVRMDLSSLEASSPTHIDGVSPPSSSTDLKEEEQEPEHSISPEIEREPVYYIDDSTSTDSIRFSTTRVCTTLRKCLWNVFSYLTPMLYRSFPIGRPPSFGQAVNSKVLSNLIDRITMSRSRSNTSTWQNHFCAVTCVSKVLCLGTHTREEYTDKTQA